MAEMVPSIYKQVVDVEIISGGSDYTTAPIVTFTGGKNIVGSAFSTATGIAVIENGEVVAVEITNPGWDYSFPPDIVFSDGPGRGAIARAVVAPIDGVYSGFKNSLQHLITSQIPAYIVSQYPQFVLFLEKYYEFLETNNQAHSILLNSSNFADIDQTLDIFLPSFKSQYLKNFPEQTRIDEKLLVKFIRQFYEAKGSSASIEFLFRALFDETIEIYYPKENILRASDGKWIIEYVARATPRPGMSLFDIAGKIVTLQYYETTGSITQIKSMDAIVADVKKLAYTNPAIFEMTFQTNISSLYIPGAGGFISASVNDTETTGGRKIGDLNEISVVEVGYGYKAAPIVRINSFGGSGATARAYITSEGAIDYVNITNRGENYGASNTDPRDFLFDANSAPILGSPVVDSTYRFNSDVASEVTEIYINDTNRRGEAITDWLDQKNNNNIDNGNTGYITVYNDLQDKIILYRVTGAWTEDIVNSNCWIIPVEMVWSMIPEDAVFVSGEKVSISYYETLIAPAVELDTFPISTHIHLKGDPSIIFGDILRILSTVTVTDTASLAPGETSYGFQENEVYQIDEQDTIGAYVEGNYFAGNYTFVGIDNKAAIKILRVNLQGLPTLVEILFSGYGFQADRFTTTIVSKNGSSVDLEFTTGAQYTTSGRFKDSKGFLSDANVLQDNEFYQPYSYVIRSKVVSREWMDILKKTVHPAGMAVFSELLITETVPYPKITAAKTSELATYKFLDDHITVLEEFQFGTNLVKQDSVLLSDSTTTTFSKVTTDSATLSDSSVLSTTKVVSDSFEITDDTFATEINKVFTDSVVLTDDLLVGFIVGYDDLVTSTETLDFSLNKVLSDSTTLTDSTSLGFSTTISEAVTAEDTGTTVNITKSISETVTTIDDPILTVVNKALSDPAIPVDAGVININDYWGDFASEYVGGEYSI